VVTVTAGGKTWQRHLQPGSSYLSSHDPRAHFGIGETETIDTLEVLWPDGTRERFPGGNADRALVVRRGEGASP
jgi:hypothetical protein